MRVHYKPWVRLLAHPTVIPNSMLDYATDFGFDEALNNPSSPISDLIARANTSPYEQSDVLSEFAGRMCYDSFTKGRAPDEYVKNVIDDRHGNVFIHPSFSFITAGISRGLSHELVRHSVGAGPSQRSQRFVKVKIVEGADGQIVYEGADCVLPPIIVHMADQYRRDGQEEKAKELIEDFVNDFQTSLKNYAKGEEKYTQYLKKYASDNTQISEMLTKRVREASRYVLPNACETRMVWSMNVRAAFNIYDRRGSYHADLEIRRLVVEFLNLMKPYAPYALNDFKSFVDIDGFPSISVPAVGI